MKNFKLKDKCLYIFIMHNVTTSIFSVDDHNVNLSSLSFIGSSFFPINCIPETEEKQIRLILHFWLYVAAEGWKKEEVEFCFCNLDWWILSMLKLRQPECTIVFPSDFVMLPGWQKQTKVIIVSHIFRIIMWTPWLSLRTTFINICYCTAATNYEAPLKSCGFTAYETECWCRLVITGVTKITLPGLIIISVS